VLPVKADKATAHGARRPRRDRRPGAGCRVLAVLPSGGPGDAHGTILSPDGKLADLPEWIPEALVERQHEDACSAAIVTEDVYGLPTLRGIRRRTLFKMACSFRARGADYPTIAATLSAINVNRSSPPLEHTEIDGIV
jgi:Primase C terminal 1 (PriCT-1)